MDFGDDLVGIVYVLEGVVDDDGVVGCGFEFGLLEGGGVDSVAFLLRGVAGLG